MFSFIIPVRNVPLPYFEDCINSIIQSCHNDAYEIVIFNDGSHQLISNKYETFISNKRCIKYEKSDSSAGIAVARNNCIRNSVGEWLCIVDADDTISYDYIDKIKPYLNASAAMIYSDHFQYDEKLEKVLQVRRKHGYHKLYMQYANTEMDPMLWSTYIFHAQIFNAAAFKEIGMFNTNYESGDEVDVHLTISEIYGSSSIGYVPNCLYKYRKNNKSVVHDKEYYNKLIKNIEDILSNHYFRRSGQKTQAMRIGRCINTNAAHYQHFTVENEGILIPYFDFETLELKYTVSGLSQ